MGCGIHSVEDYNFLIERIKYGIDLFAGEQQNGLQGAEYDKESAKITQTILSGIVRDFMKALGMEKSFGLRIL